MHLTGVLRRGLLGLGTVVVLGLAVFGVNGGRTGSGQEAAIWFLIAPVLPVAAQSPGCPIASDSTVSQAVGSPVSGVVDAIVDSLTIGSFSDRSPSGRAFGVNQEVGIFGPGEGGAAGLARQYVPRLPDAAFDEINALSQAGVSVTLPDYQLETVDEVGDAALWVKTELLPGLFLDSLLVQRGSDAFSFDVEDSPDARMVLTTLALAVLAQP
jgi:hypothetical protein